MTGDGGHSKIGGQTPTMEKSLSKVKVNPVKRSSERILTTHVGSLARPDDQLRLLFAKERGETFDTVEFESSTRSAVDSIVAH